MTPAEQYRADLAAVASHPTAIPSAVAIRTVEPNIREQSFATDRTFYLYLYDADTYAYLGDDLAARLNRRLRQPDTGLPTIQHVEPMRTFPDSPGTEYWKRDIIDPAVCARVDELRCMSGWSITHRHPSGAIQLWNSERGAYRIWNPYVPKPTYIERVCPPADCGLAPYIEAMRGAIITTTTAVPMFLPPPETPILCFSPLPLYLD